MLEDPKPVEQWFVKARKAAGTRHELRLLYMNGRFAKGEHPDTHPEFWKDWRAMELPEMPADSLSKQQSRDKLIKTGIMAVCCLLALFIFLRWWMKKSQARAAPGEFKLG